MKDWHWWRQNKANNAEVWLAWKSTDSGKRQSIDMKEGKTTWKLDVIPSLPGSAKRYQISIKHPLWKNLVVFSIYDVHCTRSTWHKPQIAKFTSSLKSLHLELLIVPHQSENNYQSNLITNLLISQFLRFDEWLAVEVKEKNSVENNIQREPEKSDNQTAKPFLKYFSACSGQSIEM